MKRALTIACAFLAAGSLAALRMPAGWDFGSVGDDRPVVGTFTAANDESSPLTVRLISPCDCLTLAPAAFSLAPGRSVKVTVTFDPAGYSGKVSKPVLVRLAGGVDRLYTVSGSVVPRQTALPSYPGECEWCRKQSDAIRRQAYESWRRQPSVVHYYYSPECKSCTEFLETEVPRVEKLLGRKIEMDRQDIRNAGVLDELDGLLARKKLTLTALPVLASGDAILMGEKQIRGEFEAQMRKREAPR
jgi:hypothetical protein